MKKLKKLKKLKKEFSSRVPEAVPEPGNRRAAGVVPGSSPKGREPGTADPDYLTREEASLFGDVASLLDGELPARLPADLLVRTNGSGLFYRGQVNHLFGDPEAGKTWVALAAAVEILRSGGKAMVIDIDHNGMTPTVGRLLTLGADKEVLEDLSKFRYSAVDDKHEVLELVSVANRWKPDLVIVDSVGELVPMFSASSNNPDDYTRVNALVMKPLATQAGASVIIIDHLAKNPESRSQGATGTTAKNRAIGGVSLRANLLDPFKPGKGGACELVIHKDRHGSVRATSADSGKNALAGKFHMYEAGEVATWEVRAPSSDDRSTQDSSPFDDVLAVAKLDPPPTTVDDATKRLGWRKQRAARAVRDWREAGEPVPSSLLLEHGAGTAPGSKQRSSTDTRPSVEVPAKSKSRRRKHGGT